VPIVTQHLSTNTRYAINALLANGTPVAGNELVREVRRQPGLPLAITLANDPRYRSAGVEAIRKEASDVTKFRWHSGLAHVV
jgi:hypothetical protein